MMNTNTKENAYPTEKKARKNVYRHLRSAVYQAYRDLLGGYMYKPRYRRIQEHKKIKELYRELLE